MIEKEHYLTPPHGLKIGYKGVFDFKDLVSNIKKWYRNRKFILTEKTYEIKEYKYGKEGELEWNGERKLDDYARLRVNITVKIWEMKKVEKLDYAELDIRFIGFVELDYKNKFDNKKGKFLRKIYHNYLIKEKIEDKYEMQIINEVREIHDNVKDMLELNK